MNPADPSQTTSTNPRRERRRVFVCGLLSAAALLLAFPPISLWGFAFLIPVPLMYAASRGPVSVKLACVAALGAAPAWVVTHNWVFIVSSFGAPILILYLGFYQAVFVYIASRHPARIPLWAWAGVCWSGVEIARSHVLGGYAWYLSPHPLIDASFGVLQAPARLGGATLVGLFVALTAGLVTQLVLDRRAGRVVVPALSLAGVWALTSAAAIVTDPERPDEIAVGVVQPNIPQDNRLEWTERQRFSDWEDIAELTFVSARDPELTPELIVWPEGLTPGWTFDPESLETERDAGYGWKMTPRFEGDAPDLRGVPRSIPATYAVDEMLEFQRRLEIPLIVGGPAFDNLRIVEMDSGLIEYQNDAQYNSVFVVSEGSVHDAWYNKLHLTPFGETMPLISRSEWLEQQLLGIAAGGMSFALTAGSARTRLSVPTAQGDVGVASPVCFEGTVPWVCRGLVFEDGERRASLLVNISNDGWFMHWDPGRRAHMQNARWRALELATPMVRSANTGFSCVVDAWGRVVSDEITPTARDPRAGYINASVALGSGSSVYARVGELVALAHLLFGAPLVLWSIWKGRSRSDENQPEEQ